MRQLIGERVHALRIHALRVHALWVTNVQGNVTARVFRGHFLHRRIFEHPDPELARSIKAKILLDSISPTHQRQREHAVIQRITYQISKPSIFGLWMIVRIFPNRVPDCSQYSSGLQFLSGIWPENLQLAINLVKRLELRFAWGKQVEISNDFLARLVVSERWSRNHLVTWITIRKYQR
jgi:hypothetical protein